MAKVFNRAVKLTGQIEKIGTPSITALEFDKNDMVRRAEGATVPTDADKGYAKGCLFARTGDGLMFVNLGTSASAKFIPVYPTLAPNATVKANAATATIAAADFPKNNTNTGASGAIVLTMPAPADVKGLAMRIYVTVAQQISLSPASTDAVYLAGSGVDDKDLVIAGVIGNYADVYCDGSDYYVIGYSGVVTKEA